MLARVTFLGLVVAVTLVLAMNAAGRPPFLTREGAAFPPGKGQAGLQLPVADAAKAKIQVEFQQTSVSIQSTRGISNAVLQYEDGQSQKFDELQGRNLTLAGTGRHAGKEIVRVWGKSAANLSGEGPGYGQRFDRPAPLPATSNPKP